ncbi:phosphotransferase enzyme family protein [Spirochaeta cellobiosiphila]|uniref:phosphotransferase enzyme family protein n=1 Tax=Spirochaeta cellobiosiphila TaxID=504483 RepID=UPI0004093C7A|nr:phosphotransferase [Spirochaeta cellobiosiphila]
MTDQEMKEIINQFVIYGDIISFAPYGSGHINDTYVVNTNQAGTDIRYIIQRINTKVFTDPEGLMSNIKRITETLQKGYQDNDVIDSSRRTLTVIPSREGKPYLVDQTGNYWRMYLFIEKALGYDFIENTTQAFEAAKSFGEYQKLLNDMKGERLVETIKDFHNTPKRFEYFKSVLAKASSLKKDQAKEEIDFYLSREEETSHLMNLYKSGKIPERITHNDCKLNNVLLDVHNYKAICVIDLDTTMPGLSLYDFGDLVRTSVVRAPEDEKDLTQIVIDMEMFRSLIDGYLISTLSFLNETERENLVFGGKIMTYEVGLRFLTDFLEGDKYFKTSYEEHNLVRTRTQMTLVKAIEKCQKEMEAYVEHRYNKLIAKN